MPSTGKSAYFGITEARPDVARRVRAPHMQKQFYLCPLPYPHYLIQNRWALTRKFNFARVRNLTSITGF